MLDLNPPDEDGTTIIDPLHREQQLGIVVVSSRSSEDSKVTAISLDADDYLTKPFSFNELLVRIKILDRRMQERGLSREALVETYRSRLSRKLKVRTIADLTRIVVMAGVVS